MDMKSYILVGGGLLICLVLLHALVSAWRANRRVPNADGEEELDALDMEAEDGAEALWRDQAEAELTGEPLVEEAVVDEEPGPPILIDRTTEAEDATADAVNATQAETLDASVASSSQDDLIPGDETVDVPPPIDDGPENAHKGRRIEIPGKRTEPTVPRAMRPDFHRFDPPVERQQPRSNSNGAESLDDVVVVWLFAKPGRQLDGEALLKAFVSQGLKCDADRVFKKTDPRCGGPWYTVANGVEPGTFDISRPAALATPGIVMLLNLGEVRDPGAAFENMLDVAQDLAISLDAELKDERISDMSAQTIEHCRQRIRDFKRMLLRA